MQELFGNLIIALGGAGVLVGAWWAGPPHDFKIIVTALLLVANGFLMKIDAKLPTNTTQVEAPE